MSSPYLTASNLASPVFSGWLPFHKVWNTGNYSVFYILKVLFCVLLFASSMPPFKENDSHHIYLILETRFERRVLQRQPISNKTEPMNDLVGLHVFSRASHTLHAMLSLRDLIGSH